jgi:hypothetical protein
MSTIADASSGLNRATGTNDKRASQPQPRNLLVQLRDQCMADSARFFPDVAHSLMFNALALCGETGELANVVKKIERGSLDPDTESAKTMLEDEAIDSLIYLMCVFGILGTDPLAAYFKKRDFNNNRFGGSSK